MESNAEMMVVAVAAVDVAAVLFVVEALVLFPVCLSVMVNHVAPMAAVDCVALVGRSKGSASTELVVRPTVTESNAVVMGVAVAVEPAAAIRLAWVTNASVSLIAMVRHVAATDVAAVAGPVLATKLAWVTNASASPVATVSSAAVMVVAEAVVFAVAIRSAWVTNVPVSQIATERHVEMTVVAEAVVVAKATNRASAINVSASPVVTVSSAEAMVVAAVVVRVWALSLA